MLNSGRWLLKVIVGVPMKRRSSDSVEPRKVLIVRAPSADRCHLSWSHLKPVEYWKVSVLLLVAPWKVKGWLPSTMVPPVTMLVPGRKVRLL